MKSFKRPFFILNGPFALIGYFLVLWMAGFPLMAGDVGEEFDPDSYIVCGSSPPTIPTILIIERTDGGDDDGECPLTLLFAKAPGPAPEALLLPDSFNGASDRVYVGRSFSLPNDRNPPSEPASLVRTYSQQNEFLDDQNDYISSSSNSMGPQREFAAEPDPVVDPPIRPAKQKTPQILRRRGRASKETLETHETLQPFVACFSVNSNDPTTRWDGRRAPQNSAGYTLSNGSTLGCFRVLPPPSKKRRSSTGDAL